MKNFTKSLLFLLTGLSLSPAFQAQITFQNETSRLEGTNNSGCSMTIVDWDNDGLDDIIRLDDGRTAWVSLQKTGQGFQNTEMIQMAGSSAWAMVVADFDKNGYVDIVGGWNGSCKVLMMNDDGTPGALTTLPASNFFLQNMTVVDINNDGWADLFTCDDNGENSIYVNDGTGNLQPQPVIDFDVTDSDDSGNYGSVWTDFDNDGDQDLYIAKCRQGVNSPTDGRRINVMFVNNGDGTYTEMAAEYGINVGWQSWTASFGDIDNDADFDLLLTNHDYQSQIFENDGNGYYTDITEGTGFDITDMTPIQSMMEDFDNDGFVDIIVSGSEHRFYKNNGDNTFTDLSSSVFDNNDMLTFSTGDLNHDGKIDVFAGYGSIYTTPSSTSDKIWMNTTQNNNHFFTLDLHGTISNTDAVGARVFIYGAWGVQTREVRSGESYGTVNSAMLHFGLGEATVIDSVRINWPSGITQAILNPSVDQFLTVVEQECVSPEAIITADGEFVLCGGNALMLNAPEGYQYLWSTGDQTETLEVTEEGEYNVMVTDVNSGCFSQSKTIVVVQTPDETPSVSVSGLTEFCAGGSVEIVGPQDLNSYTWSNGETTQSITVNETGTYSLTIQGSCAEFTSVPVSVQVVVPGTPSADDVMIVEGSSTVLNATGSNVVWFEDTQGLIELASGNEFTTPVLNESTTYYIQSSQSFGGGTEQAGQESPAGSSYGQGTTNSAVFFDVAEASTIDQITVYTDTPGERKIDLFDSDGVLLNSFTANLISGENQLNLNFDLNPGTGYYLLTDASSNQALLGTNSPRLVRDFSQIGYAYPYNVGGALSITGTTFGNTYYFYFYDWQITRQPTICYSNLVPVTVTVESSIGFETLESQLTVMPNPAKEFIRVPLEGKNAVYSIIDASGRVISSGIQLNEGVVNVNSLSSGLYLIQIQDEKSVRSAKFLKQ
jgi:hypothetical protein